MIDFYPVLVALTILSACFIYIIYTDWKKRKKRKELYNDKELKASLLWFKDYAENFLEKEEAIRYKNTILQMLNNHTPKEEIKAYIEHIKPFQEMLGKLNKLNWNRKEISNYKTKKF